MAAPETFLGLNRRDFQLGALGIGAFGVGMSAVGNILGGFEKSSQLKTAAASSRRAATIERMNAAMAEDQTEINSSLQMRKWLKAIGENRAKIAASGGSSYDMDTTMAMGVVEDIGEMEMDLELIKYGGDVRAWNHRTQADSLLTQASIYGNAAGSAKVQGIARGLGGILEGTLALGNNYFKVE